VGRTTGKPTPLLENQKKKNRFSGRTKWGGGVVDALAVCVCVVVVVVPKNVWNSTASFSLAVIADVAGVVAASYC